MLKILTHKGTVPIKTERLLLRPICTEDYRDMYRYTVKEEVARYVSWTPHKSPEETKALCSMWESEYKSGERYNWAIVFDGRVIGNIDIVALAEETALFGWQIDSDYWNMGIMTEAAKAVARFMFDEVGVQRAESCHISVNIGSGRVMQKMGMNEIPYSESLHYKLKSEREIDGQPLIFYSMTREEYCENYRRKDDTAHIKSNF